MKNEKIMKKKEVCFLPSLLPTYLPQVPYVSQVPTSTYMYVPISIYTKFYVPYYRYTLERFSAISGQYLLKVRSLCYLKYLIYTYLYLSVLICIYLYLHVPLYL